MKYMSLFFLFISLLYFPPMAQWASKKWIAEKYKANPNFFFQEYRLQKNDRISSYKEILKQKLQQKQLRLEKLWSEKIWALQQKLETIKIQTSKDQSMWESRKHIRLSLILGLEDILESARKWASTSPSQNLEL